MPPKSAKTPRDAYRALYQVDIKALIDDRYTDKHRCMAEQQRCALSTRGVDLFDLFVVFATFARSSSSPRDDAESPRSIYMHLLYSPHYALVGRCLADMVGNTGITSGQFLTDCLF